jgi:hypothetical protein
VRAELRADLPEHGVGEPKDATTAAHFDKVKKKTSGVGDGCGGTGGERKKRRWLPQREEVLRVWERKITKGACV